jgi:hypothetical protein
MIENPPNMSPRVHNRFYIELAQSARLFNCEQQGTIDYIWIRAARFQGASSKLQSGFPIVDDKWEKER